MLQIATGQTTDAAMPLRNASQAARLLVIGIISFLTLVDLFAAQAILPSLVRVYRTTPAMMGFAVNASTIGMAVAGIVVALASRRLNRRRGIWLALVLLALPTSLLATAPNIAIFMALRIAQGLCMSTAFTLTMAYLAEQSGAEDTASALAAYITGNVASNFFGRLMSAAISNYLGLHANFYIFAALNLAGAAISYYGLSRTSPMTAMTTTMGSPLAVWGAHLRNPALRASFGIGFLILFAFIGTFTYVNFVLVRAPVGLSAMSLGLVAKRIGTRVAFWGASAFAIAGLPLLLAQRLDPILCGLAMVGAGTFFAQAVATGFVGRAAATDRAAASGMYLASYYLGGVAGSAALGQIFERFGWSYCVAAIGAALVLGMALARRLKLAPT
jgi:predicted MFS family arabinose efflux permease